MIAPPLRIKSPRTRFRHFRACLPRLERARAERGPEDWAGVEGRISSDEMVSESNVQNSVAETPRLYVPYLPYIDNPQSRVDT